MTSLGREFLVAAELHAVDALRAVLDAGLDPTEPLEGKAPLDWLLEMYTRSPRLRDCLQVLLEAGAEIDDPLLCAVLLDDDALGSRLAADPSLTAHRVTLGCAFTPLVDVTLLHVAAEYGHLRAARALVDAGADLDDRAGIDEHGLGGQTPLFHTVNSTGNHGRPVLDLLLEAGASVNIGVAGLVWGQGFDWETTLFDLTPISYAQAGLLPQMHRDPLAIQDNVETLLRAAGRPVPPRRNIPNRYLTEGDEA